MYNTFGKFPEEPDRHYIHSNQSSVHNSPNLRNQFLSNANPSSDNVTLHHHHPNDNLAFNETDDSFNFAHQPPLPPLPHMQQQTPYSPLHASSSSTTFSSHPLKKSETANVNEYELSSMRKPSNTPLINPFANHNHNFSDSYNNRPISSDSANPFNEPAIPDDRFQPGNRHAPKPPPTKEELENEKIRKNERARIKQLRRHPRFHYTKLPYFTIIVTLIQVIVFIVELIKMAQLTGSAFQTKPYFNPMLGPSTYVLINMGARYVPCMHSVTNITDDTSISFPCANSTSSDTNVCSLSQLCGLGGVPVNNDGYQPDQWYRIITPIFLHAGFLHILFNLLLQVTMGATIERSIGFIKYFIIYIASGIGGFLLGANFSPNGIASTGASGSLFGIMATNITMFIFSGRKNTNLYKTKHYTLFIFIMIGEILVSLVLGLLPGLDNFSHIGGFAVGLLLAVVFLPDPSFCYEDSIITYNAHDNTWQQFVNSWNPAHNWEDKLPVRVYIWASVRVAALVLTIVYYVALVKNFFGTKEKSNDNNCKWCKYINCIPVHGWCQIGEVSVETSDEDGDTSSATPSASATSSPTGLQKRRARQYTTLGKWQDNPSTLLSSPSSAPKHRQITSGHGYVNDQHAGLGLGFFIIIATLTYRFCQRKKIV